jgi:hypothetical protein
LTVVFDDAELYRRLKVRAAERGVPMKRLIEEAVRGYLGPAPEAELKPIDWDAFDNWMKEVEEADADAGDVLDLSDIKRHLYGYPGPADHRLALAEERAPYDAGE